MSFVHGLRRFPQVPLIACKIPPAESALGLSIPIDDITCDPAQGIGALVEAL